MPVWMSRSAIMHCDRLCHSFFPKFYSKTQWKLTHTESWSSWRRIHSNFIVNCEGIWVMPVWMSRSAIMYCDRLCHSFFPKFYSKTQWKLTQTESWSSWRRIHSNFIVNCEGIWVMPVGMSRSAIMHCDRLCHSFSPKFYSKTQWKLTQTESWVSWRRMYRKCHVNCEGIWVMPVWMSRSAIMHCDRLCHSFFPKFYSKTQWKLTHTESWSSWRRIHSIFIVNCEGIWVMPVWMSRSAIMHCDRLCHSFSPKFYSKTQWKLTQTESWVSWRRIHSNCFVNCEGIWVIPV